MSSMTSRTRIPRRISRLGTETAFAVSGDAAAWAAQGTACIPSTSAT